MMSSLSGTPTVGRMLTAGIDLAAEDSSTAVAWIRWTAKGGMLENLIVGADDTELLHTVSTADKVGIDCPLGWPVPFVDFLVSHHRGELAVAADLSGRAWRRSLVWRRTDKVTHTLIGRPPLTVAADRIAHMAMRCAALQARLAEDGQRVDRTGTGTLVEVYPAASLKKWGLPYRGYKGSRNGTALGELVDKLITAAPWLHLGAFERECRSTDHAIDAVVAALTARAAAVGQATRPGPADLATAAVEGWIAVPNEPLASLIDRSARRTT